MLKFYFILKNSVEGEEILTNGGSSMLVITVLNQTVNGVRYSLLRSLKKQQNPMMLSTKNS